MKILKITGYLGMITFFVFAVISSSAMAKDVLSFKCHANYYYYTGGLETPGWKYIKIKDSESNPTFGSGARVSLDSVFYSVSVEKKPSGRIDSWITLQNNVTGSRTSVAGASFTSNRLILDLQAFDPPQKVGDRVVKGLAVVCEPQYQ